MVKTHFLNIFDRPTQEWVSIFYVVWWCISSQNAEIDNAVAILYIC